MKNMNKIVGNNDIVFITLDTLRYDVAQKLWEDGKLPNFSKLLPKTGWEKRHSPASFTYASHQAFFAGFLPTKIKKKQERLFATKFEGSETATSNTYIFNEENIVKGFKSIGYKTVCIGGVGFFNKKTPLSKVFPNMFEESYWQPEFGVTEYHSTKYQLEKAVKILDKATKNIFLFINISALHQPNYFYLNKSINEDTLATHASALEYVDSQFPILINELEKRKKTFLICCSDHGTTYGEDGFFGHRLAHSNVWNVPYFDKLIK